MKTKLTSRILTSLAGIILASACLANTNYTTRLQAIAEKARTNKNFTLHKDRNSLTRYMIQTNGYETDFTFRNNTFESWNYRGKESGKEIFIRDMTNLPKIETLLYWENTASGDIPPFSQETATNTALKVLEEIDKSIR